MAFLPSTHHFSLPEQRALALIPHFTAPLSMIGSGLIIRDVILYKDEKVMYHKLLLGMSCFDLIASFWFALSTAPMPKETIEVWSPIGTTGTCTAQGFFIQTSLGTAVFNASLSIYYLLMARYEWTEERIKKIEKYMLFIPVVLAYGTALAALAMKLLNSAVLWCWIAPRPEGCYVVASQECVFDDVPCPFRWTLFYGPLWICIVIAMVSMILVYRTVLQQEKAVDAYQYDGQMNRERSKRVAKQAFFYILAFYISWLPATVYSGIEFLSYWKLLTVSKEILFGLAVPMGIFTPMQGFLNFLVYFRAKYNLYKRDNPDSPVAVAVREAAFNANIKKKVGVSIQDSTEMSRTN